MDDLLKMEFNSWIFDNRLLIRILLSLYEIKERILNSFFKTDI